jgi:hypothetical protein
MTSASVPVKFKTRKASEKLFEIFLQDPELNALYRLAINERFMGSGYFIANLTQPLEKCLLHLYIELQYSMNMELGHLISQTSRFIAKKVYQEVRLSKSQFMPRTTKKAGELLTEPVSKRSGKLPEEGSTFEDGEEVQHEHKLDVLVVQGQKFIEGSRALVELRRDFRAFVQPPHIYDVTSLRPYSKPQHYTSRWNIIYESAMSYLAILGLREPNVPLGHKRIRWKNASSMRKCLISRFY